MPEIMFKFNIGDIVVAKVGEAESNSSAAVGAERNPRAFMITERLSQECPGGIQYLYTVSHGAGDAHRVNEIELMLESESDYSGRSKKIAATEEQKLEDSEAKYEARMAERRKMREQLDGN